MSCIRSTSVGPVALASSRSHSIGLTECDPLPAACASAVVSTPPADSTFNSNESDGNVLPYTCWEYGSTLGMIENVVLFDHPNRFCTARIGQIGIGFGRRELVVTLGVIWHSDDIPLSFFHPLPNHHTRAETWVP